MIEALKIPTVCALVMPGNRCGHDPRAPRFYAPSPRLDEARFPRFIRQAIKAMRRIYTEPRLFQTLKIANGSTRQQRTERREACAALAGALVQYLDIETLIVGRPGEKGFNGLTMIELAQLAGLTLRRAERAMRDLVRAGLVKVFPICEKNEAGEYKGRAAIRTISKHLFGLLGMGNWLEKERKAAYKRKREKVHATPEAQARAGLALEMARATLAGKATPAEKAAAIREALTGSIPGAPPGR